LGVWLENAHSRPRNCFWGGCDTLGGENYQQNISKGALFGEFVSFEPSPVKIGAAHDSGMSPMSAITAAEVTPK